MGLVLAFLLACETALVYRVDALSNGPLALLTFASWALGGITALVIALIAIRHPEKPRRWRAF